MLRRLGIADLALITVGAVIGSGIFRTPGVVAARAHAPASIIGAWVFGGFIALCGVGIFAELAARRPSEGGFYAYLRDAFHPMVAFVFGWMFMFVIDPGAVAASAVTFANYFEPLTGLQVAPSLVASAAIAFFMLVNFLGVRQGGTTQNILVVLKLAGIAMLLGVGIFAHPATGADRSFVPFPTPGSGLAAFGIALIPVFFAYNGFVNPTYLIGEAKNPARTVPLGLIIGICIVIPMYVGVNLVCVHVLGAGGLAATKTPASDVMSAAFGSVGARIIAIVVTLSTLGFVSTKMLVTPRLYHRMAVDGMFFKPVAWVHPKTRVPLLAIAIQGAIAIIIAASGTFDSIVNYVVSFNYSFVALGAVALFIFKRRDAGKPAEDRVYFKIPGHPYTTLLFIIAVVAVVIDTFVSFPVNTAIGSAIIVAGVIAYFVWTRVSPASPEA